MSNSYSATRKSLSVTERLTTLGIAAFIGFGSMLAVGWIEASRTGDALIKESRIRNLVADVNEMRIANLDMVLAAMDSIVDKADKTIMPERTKVMSGSVQLLIDKAQNVIDLAREISNPDLVASFAAEIAIIDKAMRFRPTFWRLMPAWKRHAPGMPARALPWSPRRSASWPGVRPERPRILKP